MLWKYIIYDLKFDFTAYVKTHNKISFFINPLHAVHINFYSLNEKFVYTFDIYKSFSFPYARVSFLKSVSKLKHWY